MNKIVLQFGLLVFFLSIFFFSQEGMGVVQSLLRSFVIFAVVTSMCSVLAIVFIRSINKSAMKPDRDFEKNLIGQNKNE
jgi:hypothetical protein